MPDSDDHATTDGAQDQTQLHGNSSPPMVAELPETMEESRLAWLNRMGD